MKNKPVFAPGQRVSYSGFLVTIRRVAFFAGRVQYWIASPLTTFSFRWVNEDDVTEIVS